MRHPSTFNQELALAQVDIATHLWDEAELAEVEAYINRLPPWEPPPPNPPAPDELNGHNGAPAPWPISEPTGLPKVEDTRFAQQIEAIIDSDYAAIEKLILLKIRLRCDHQKLAGAFPSYATLARAASVEDGRTVRNAIDELVKDGILTREERPGKSFAYGLSKPRLQEVIADFIVLSRQRRGPGRPPNNPPTCRVGGLSQKPPSSNAPGFPENPPHLVQGVSENPPHPMQKPPSWDVPRSSTYLEEREGGPPSAASSSSPPIDRSPQKSLAQTNGSAAMAAALNPEAAYAFDNVRVERGALVIAEPLRADLRGEGYADVDIDLALPRALERAGLSTDPVKLLRGIRWALSYVRQDKAKAKAVKPSTKGTSRYAT